ncbi:MAG: ABC transporter ATP-binding protein [Opitutales bacterium]
MSDLLRVEDLAVHFHTRQGVVRAVDGVSFEVAPGEVLGIVGESGCGKSVSCYALLGLIPSPPGRIERGSAYFAPRDVDLVNTSETKLRDIRGKDIAMIFQDPMTSLNPYLRIGTQLIEPLQVHDRVGKRASLEMAEEALVQVGLPSPRKRLESYPHELSGGQRQRVMIAMALMLKPKLLVADEPTTALDVTVQAQILDLIEARRRDAGLGVILITHDLAVVAERCDRLVVMYAGMVMETGTTSEVFDDPRHPYTRALLRALPSSGVRGEPLFALEGGPPDLSHAIPGDPLALRPGVTHGNRWSEERPPLVQHTATHWSRESDVQLPV